jgi:DNA-binding IclR family transcriptional regulator
MTQTEVSGSNRTLERAAAILDAVGQGSLSASDVARRTGLSVSTAHRLVLALSDYGFLSREGDGNFRMGERFVVSALANVAAPILMDLRRETGETVQLWIRRRDERVCLVSLDAVHELRATVPVDSCLPLPAGSSGRLLALDEEALAQIADRGWVESVGIRTPGLGSVSAPVRRDATIIAAVCLALPMARVRESPGEDYGRQIVDAARRVSEAMVKRAS